MIGVVLVCVDAETIGPLFNVVSVRRGALCSLIGFALDGSGDSFRATPWAIELSSNDHL